MATRSCACFLGQEEEYRRARRALLDRFGATTDPYLAEPVGRACLLLPVTEDELRKAAALTDRAVAAKGIDTGMDLPIFSVRQGPSRVSPGPTGQRDLTDERGSVQGHGARPPPGRGHGPVTVRGRGSRRARRSQRPSSLSTGRRPRRTAAMSGYAHILRREAEALILPNLPAFLRGDYQPQDNDERLALLGICQFQGRCDAAARLYADAFAADPDLAEDLTRQCRCPGNAGGQTTCRPRGGPEHACRYPAARCAALAGCGLGKRWGQAQRRGAGALAQAGARVAARPTWPCGPRHWTAAPARPVTAKKMLTNWQADPDLAGLREFSALEKLPADEREECLALWKEVDGLLNRPADP